MRMLVSACVHIHKNGITHRNLSPENILVDTKSSKLKIIDFGLSKNDNTEKLPNHPAYLAPEIYSTPGDHEAYHSPCDMWSLGVVMY